jgi:hypothetical protein
VERVGMWGGWEERGWSVGLLTQAMLGSMLHEPAKMTPAAWRR